MPKRSSTPKGIPRDVPHPRAAVDFDLQEAADYLHTTTRHVRRLVAERRIAYLKVGSLLRFRQQDLDDYIESQRVEPWGVA